MKRFTIFLGAKSLVGITILTVLDVFFYVGIQVTGDVMVVFDLASSLRASHARCFTFIGVHCLPPSRLLKQHLRNTDTLLRFNAMEQKLHHLNILTDEICLTSSTTMSRGDIQ
jgi:hypothetical protein